MKQNVALSILTPFSSKSAKNEKVAAQKTELNEGSKRGLEITIFMLLFKFCTLFLPMLKQIYMFMRSRNPFFKVLNSTFRFFQKHLFHPRLSHEGAFVAETVWNPFIFLCFVNVE